MLELRPNCECCDRDLAVDATDVYICSFECTWCASCAAAFGERGCPNCGGELVRRPVRPSRSLVTSPASSVRVFNPDCLTAVR
jgi:hypothetical protein